MAKDDKLQNVELVEADQPYILEQMGPIGGLFGEEIAFQGVVEVSEAGAELKQRILVIGRYKTLIIKKTKFIKKLKRLIHHYDLVEIAEPSSNAGPAISDYTCIEIKHKSNAATATSVPGVAIPTLFIKAPDRKIENIIIKAMVFMTYTISRGFPPEALLKISLPKDRYQSPPFNHEFGIDGKGIAEQYVAHSHYFNRKATLDFLRHLETLYHTRYPEIDFGQIPGIDPTCSLGFNLFTAITCLRHNPFIKSLKICNVPHINVVSSVSEMMYTNTAISEITLSNLLSEQSFAPLGVTLQHIGHHSALQVLNLSSNTFSYDATSHPRAWHCSSQAFERNFAMSLTLEKLNLSGNRFQDTGTSAFVSWLCKIRGVHALKELRLSASQLNFGMLAAALRALEAIELIDFSKNKINLANTRLLATEAVGSFRALRYLDMSECGLFGDSLRTLLMSLVANKLLPRYSLTLNVSNNGFSGKSSTVLCELLKESTFLGGLDISMNSFSTQNLVDIMAAMAGLSGMTAFNIGYNNTSVSDDALIAGVVDFAHRHQQLTKLGVAVHRGLAASLHPLIQALYNNKSITALDITGNDMNDHGACLLADCLRNNKCLQKLFVSGNKFTAVGWQSLASPFVFYRNTSLTKLELPKPSDQLMTSDSNLQVLSTERRQQLEASFQLIRLHLELNKNRVSAASRFSYLPSSDPPLYVKPPASVPEHLAHQEGSLSSSSSPTLKGSLSSSNMSNGSNGSSSGSGSSNGSSNHKSMIPSIFAKPINSFTKPINSLLHMADMKEIPEVGYSPARKMSVPNTWNDDDWKQQQASTNGQDDE
ncbi:hypothetical protein SAMD00019534_092530 [Acytostelium subglobosum LB1]|uniref:hypothetical protein n=1 Tax=Acytostelium subglobosum LB1 TaxID=1410327 RepID=UPI000644A526|nr:hypothetical protein SAMD00019534_092530 [Acytostelium subglobosum LB1]GAM26078.1 hypothetical protein SAMD00019534_092530 [Acytostelium subglobosum LB1]|eukprot:XP_012751121.1 hypothetical protein SAMD00019534_092530 [Acytostelium subglobosum LB1]